MMPEGIKKLESTNFRSTLISLRENQTIIVWTILLILVGIASIISPVFLTSRNLINVLRQASVLGIIAIGQSYVLLSRGADLSQSAVMTLSAVVSFNILNSENRLIVPVILISIAIGAAVGVINGIMVSKVKVPPFLLTLGTRGVFVGLGLVYTHGTPASNYTELFRQVLGRFTFLGIPGQVIIWFGLFVVFWVILAKSTYGRKLYATGGNPQAARQSGIKVDRMVIVAYIISGILAAIGGLVLAGRSGYADNEMGLGYELNAIASCVIGGTAFSGGRGSLVGTVGGVLLMIVLQNILSLLGLSPSAFQVASGLVIVAAVTILIRQN